MKKAAEKTGNFMIRVELIMVSARGTRETDWREVEAPGPYTAIQRASPLFNHVMDQYKEHPFAYFRTDGVHPDKWKPTSFMGERQ